VANATPTNSMGFLKTPTNYIEPLITVTSLTSSGYFYQNIKRLSLIVHNKML